MQIYDALSRAERVVVGLSSIHLLEAGRLVQPALRSSCESGRAGEPAGATEADICIMFTS